MTMFKPLCATLTCNSHIVIRRLVSPQVYVVHAGFHEYLIVYYFMFYDKSESILFAVAARIIVSKLGRLYKNANSAMS